jgi:hypothetical protein
MTLSDALAWQLVDDAIPHSAALTALALLRSKTLSYVRLAEHLPCNDINRLVDSKSTNHLIASMLLIQAQPTWPLVARDQDYVGLRGAPSTTFPTSNVQTSTMQSKRSDERKWQHMGKVRRLWILPLLASLSITRGHTED